MDALGQWLESVGSRAFNVSATLLLVLNAAAAIVVVLRRDRTLVNRWTSRLLAADLLLLGAGLGIPLATTLARTALATAWTFSSGFSSGSVRPPAPPKEEERAPDAHR